jgi:hypothetical protein
MGIFKGVALAALAAGIAGPAVAAAQFSVKVTDPVLAIPNNNDYKSNLAANGLHAYTADLATISLPWKAKVKFEFWGSESGFSDGFKAGGGAISVVENGSGKLPWMARSMGTLVYNGGNITDWFFTSVQGTPLAGIGHTAFGIFVPQGTQVGSTYKSSVLFLGFDDQPTNFDDNHDDIIIKVTAMAVPEPASWAMLIAGFGLVGAAARRRRTVVAA